MEYPNAQDAQENPCSPATRGQTADGSNDGNTISFVPSVESHSTGRQRKPATSKWEKKETTMPKSHRSKRIANRIMEAYRIKRRFRNQLIQQNLTEADKDVQRI